MKSCKTHIKSKTNLVRVSRPSHPVRFAKEPSKSMVIIEQELIKKLEEASKEEIMGSGTQWDEIEELSAARSHRQVKDKSNKMTELEELCLDPKNACNTKCKIDDV
jgi:hypothetical protein